jgi:hypothetical protein
MPGPWDKYAQPKPQEGPWAKYAQPQPAEAPASAPPEPQPSMMQQAGTMAKDLGTGILKGAGSTANNIGHMLYPDFIAKHLTGTPSAEQQESYFAPKNTTQAVGKGAEQIGEFFIPGGAEEAAGEKLATMAPKLAKVAKPLARIAGTEAVNEAQGGTPGMGAAGGAAGELVGAGMRAMAPKLAESGLGITKADRAFGKTPGKAILNETKGFRPNTIADSGQQRLNELTPELESAVAKSPNPVSLAPARQITADAEAKAMQLNAPGLYGQMTPMSDFLDHNFATMQKFPQDVPASDALNLKRGFSKEFLGKWNPETHADTLATGRKAYRALDAGIDQAVPEAAGLNQRISSLIPVVHRAESVSRNAPTAQLMMKRIAAPTGALLGPIFGGEEGYRHGGVPGAIAGAGIGMAAPLLVTTPEGQMIMARGFHATEGLRPLVSSGLQMARKSPKDKGGPEQ